MGKSIDKSFEEDRDETGSFRSLDLEEAKAMLRDAPEQNAFMESGRRRRLNKILYPCSIITNLFLFVLVLAILGHPCYFSSRTCVYSAAESTSTTRTTLKLMAEEHGLVPEFGLEKVTFMNDSRYANEDMFEKEEEYDKILKQWDQDMPIGRGFVQIPDEGAKWLPNPYHLRENPQLNGYSIASLHQFHCIYMIMRGFGDYKFKRPNHDPDMERHVTHCFDYLRQSAQCAGDAALEGASTTIHRMTDGWGNTHVCKKNSELLKWVIDNRLSDNTGIH